MAYLSKVDHLVFACQDLKEGIIQMENQLGVTAVMGGKHPAFGTANALLSLGDHCYLEIIGPDPTVKSEKLPTIFGISTLKTPRLMAFAIKENALEKRVTAIQKMGTTFGQVFDMSRERPDGVTLHWRLTNPLITIGNGILPFLIDWGTTPHPAKYTPKGCHLEHLHIQHPNMTSLQSIFSTLEFMPTLSIGKKPAIIATIATPKGIVILQ